VQRCLAESLGTAFLLAVAKLAGTAISWWRARDQDAADRGCQSDLRPQLYQDNRINQMNEKIAA
jgi:hypothetical protein